MEIHRAAAQGDKDAVLRELELGVSVDALDDEGQTPLIVAAKSHKSSVEMMRLLLELGANPNAVGYEYSNSALLEAVGTGELARVQCLLNAGADVNLIIEDSLDSLTCAVSDVARTDNRSTLPMVELLLEHGASLGGGESGQVALTKAFENGHFEVVKRLLEVGGDEAQLQWTTLMRAIVIGTTDDVREQLEQGANLMEREEVGERTPWLLALSGGDIGKAKLLLAAGAQRDDIGWFQKTTLMYPIESNNPEMLEWLLSVGCDVDAAGESGETALMKAAQENSALFVRMLLEAGANPDKVSRTYGNTIEFTTSMEVARLLIGARQDINNASKHTRALLFGIGYDDTVVVSREECDIGAQPRFGIANPEKMDIPLWQAMARTGESSEARRALFANYDSNLLWENCVGSYPFEKYPLWFYPRNGMSLTALPDGRFVEIGGYFEEGGNPNFCIYNEVFVRHPDQKLDIYGYPLNVFPPTDGHSATLVGEYIYIIGCIGYPDERIVGYTPIYRLNIETFAIEKVETSGDNPGWIFNHLAVLVGDEIHIRDGQVWLEPQHETMERIYALLAKENISSTQEWNEAIHQHYENSKQPPGLFALNLKSLQWRRLLE